MSIKIYLPFDYFYLKSPINLYGQVHINDDNVIVYYVMEGFEFESSDNAMDQGSTQMRFLGAILNADSYADQNQHHNFDMRLCFTYSSVKDNISLIYIGITPERLKHIKLILFEKSIMRNLFVAAEPENKLPLEEPKSRECDFLELFRLAQPPVDIPTKNNGAKRSILNLLNIIASLPITLFQCIADSAIVNSVMVHTTVYKHFKEWQLTYAKGSRTTNIVLDRVMGMIFMVILFSLATKPGDFLIQISHAIIGHLYSLLKVLEGSPIGLKLNIHLNNFFLDCFKYHIELWSTFLDFIEPLVRQVYLAIGVFGCLGLTFQIALLADLISVIGLHSHCFYIYTKVLYNVERKGLSVLWQVVRGNRYNILKGIFKLFVLLGRTEAHNYMNRQLYLATIFFSAILFLFPTTLVYYIVFAALKALTSACLSIFEFFRRKFLDLPIEGCLKWLIKGCSEIDCLKIIDVSLPREEFLMNKQNKINVSVYKIET
ncbi:hypothetical protein KR009_004215 [Drosophila setifemur]|nr:hypothetical protein KR009_004215 [Drosophila setifemur]